MNVYNSELENIELTVMRVGMLAFINNIPLQMPQILYNKTLNCIFVTLVTT